jgi:DNA polymerase-3 subunit epsilon
MRELVGFDTETTGVDVEQDRIVTAALVWRQADGSTQTQTWLLDPGVEIPEHASAIHGITTQKAQTEGQPAAEGLDQIATALAELVAKAVPVLAYNGSFDLRILRAELLRHQLPSLEERSGTTCLVIDPLVIDRAVDRYRKGKRQLVDLMGVYGINQSENLHDALEDVLQAIAVFDAIEHKHQEITALDPTDLHRWQATKHRAWAENFNQFLASRGRTPDVDLAWP